jgi:hypothetical protein
MEEIFKWLLVFFISALSVSLFKVNRCEVKDEEPRIDHRFSFEISCARDKNG